MLDITLTQLKQEVLEAFFQAIIAGYAGGKKNQEKELLEELLDCKMTRFEQGRYQVTDMWRTLPNSDYSFGETVVYRDIIPIWVMSYQGWYDGEVIPFLKEALRNAYEQRQFVGGRGPEKYETGDLMYVNSYRDNRGDWRRFSESEMILRGTKVMGYHHYQGILLLKTN